jgi:hypothetical protein
MRFSGRPRDLHGVEPVRIPTRQYNPHL